MHNSADFLHLIAVYLLILVAPGLDFAVVLRESLLYGRGRGIMAAFGVACAVAIHCTYTILGLGLIIAKSLLLFNMIKWAGIAYLLYIGGKALFAKKAGGAAALGGENSAGASRPQLRQAYAAGFICNLLNPKCVLFFLAVFSALVPPSAALGMKAAAALVMVLCCFCWFSAVAFFLTLPQCAALYRRAARWIDKATGAVFIALGIGLMFQKAQ